MANKARYLLALAICGGPALWSAQAAARGRNPVFINKTQPATTQHRINQLQQEINNLQQQIQTMKQKQPQQQQQAAAAQKKKGPKKKLTLGGGVVGEYQYRDQGFNGSLNRRPGGNFILDYFEINTAGQYGNLTYGAEYRLTTVNFADPGYLHYGWADYAFGPGKASHVKGGFFKVPFGNLPYGYQSFWGNLAYYTGFTDNQAAGLGYKYEANGVRFDLDAFKNDDLLQNSTYGANPFNGYQQINGGVGRIAYTFNHDGDNTVEVSAAGRGGQLEVGSNSGPTSTTGGQSTGQIGIVEGTRWAGTLAVDAELGNWTLQAQAVDYRYNIPSNRSFNGNTLPTDSITFENYGFAYQLPAAGQLYGANAAYTFDVDFGPISQFVLYDDYNYLSVGKIGGNGHFNSTIPGNGDPNSTGNIQVNEVGAEMVAGPVYIWADLISSKNGAAVFDGPNDGQWHHRFNLALAFYFSGDVVHQ